MGESYRVPGWDPSDRWMECRSKLTSRSRAACLSRLASLTTRRPANPLRERPAHYTRWQFDGVAPTTDRTVTSEPQHTAFPRCMDDRGSSLVPDQASRTSADPSGRFEMYL